MIPLIPDAMPNLREKSVLISAGNSDGLIPKESIRPLTDLLEKQGAKVELNWADSDHSLTRPEIEIVRHWLRNSS